MVLIRAVLAVLALVLVETNAGSTIADGRSTDAHPFSREATLAPAAESYNSCSLWGVKMRLLFVVASLLAAATTFAQTKKPSDIAEFVSVDAPVLVPNHVRVIDGTGSPAREDQAIVVANGQIQSIGPAASAEIPQGAQRMERAGYTVIPGMVGMHNHLYYTDSFALQVVDGKSASQACSSPRYHLQRRDSI